MGVFEQFPYTNFHDLNLNWIIQELQKLTVSVQDFISINAIKYADPIQWDITSQYEKNTVVLDKDGNAYLSVQPVPAGVSLDRTEYWTNIGNFSALWESVKEAITIPDEGHETTASAPRAVHDLVWVNGKLLEVLSPMIAGDQYSIGSNCRVYSVQILLKEFLSNFNDVENNIVDINNNIAALSTKFTKLFLVENSPVLTVAKSGAMFNTITDAVNYAKNYAKTDKRVTIKIASGLYEESINIYPNPGIDLIGEGPNITEIRATKPYPEGALYTVGSGFFSNIKFSSNFPNSYGMHWEAQNVENHAGLAVFENCIFYGSNHAGAGIGTGEGDTITFKNCDFETAEGQKFALYMHNYPHAANSQFVNFHNCGFTNNGGGTPIRIENARKINNPGEGKSYLYLSFAGSFARKPIMQYQESATQPYSYITGDEVLLLDNSFTNGIPGVDTEDHYREFRDIVFFASQGYATLQIANAEKFSCTVKSATLLDGTNVVGDVTIDSATQNSVVLHTTDPAALGQHVQVQVIVTPV